MAAYEELRSVGIPHARAVVMEADAPVPSALGVAFPVAVKILSGDVAHKSDIGGVVLNVGPDDLDAAIARVRASAASHLPSGVRTRVMVQEMRTGVGEALIGYRVDPDVGPLVMLAPGGVLAELSTERSLRLAPVDADTAREMVAELRAFRALAGYRGRPAGHLDALAHAIVALSRLATHPAVVEAEINPLIVLEAGCGVVAVDALVRVADR
jgi:succinyl-CoA synthetase beta subunit